jgi:hypothetical protein
MKKTSVLILAALCGSIILMSCSSMYLKPTIQATLYHQKVPGNASMLFKAAQYVIPALGYKIEGNNMQEGTITTAPIEMKLDPGSCDCGSSMGLPIIKSSGTKAKVYFVIAVSDSELTIKAEIVPELGDLMSTLGTAANIACVSKGRLEETLARDFLKKMKASAMQMIFKQDPNGF